MTAEEQKSLGEQLGRLDEALSGIQGAQERQETALVDIFKENRETGAKLASLDTVIRMSIAEQKRINQELRDDITRIDCVWKDRGRPMERKMGYFVGGLISLLVVIDLVVKVVF